MERRTSYTYDADNRVKTAQTGDTKVTYTYDAFGRVAKQITTNGTTTVLTETYTYNGNSSQVKTYATTAGGVTTTYTYTYDDNGNITSIHDGTYTTTYHYDSANQLIREDNEADDSTCTWEYDNAGNIIAYNYGPYTTEELSADYYINYEYSDGPWGDVLVSYETTYYSTTLSCDEIGNTTNLYSREGYIDKEYYWRNGRQLASSYRNNIEWCYSYNADGLRTKRTDGTTTYNYIYNGSQLTGMTVDGHTLYFAYDAAGTPMSVNYDGVEYFYTTNLQGDVIGIGDGSGNTVVTYAYTAWGEHQWTSGTVDETLKEINPLRYRGYVYDVETNLYYLQSRYYDPYLCRFINGDGFAATGQGFIGNNMFAYCGNNPVRYVDYSGERHIEHGSGGGGFPLYSGSGGGGNGTAPSRIAGDWGTTETVIAAAGLAAAATIITFTVADQRQEQFAIRQYNRVQQEQIEKADAVLRSIVRKSSPVRYWTATINRAYVDIGRPLTFRQAVNEVAAGRSVFAVTRWEAKAVARAAGGNVGANNGELPNDLNKNGTIGYYDHFHTYNRNGAHIFYLFG